MSPTQPDRDRAHRLGTLAAKAGRGLGGACPYNANGTGDERVLAAVFVRAYIDAGGTVDGLDYGRTGDDEPDEFVFRGRTYRRAES